MQNTINTIFISWYMYSFRFFDNTLKQLNRTKKAFLDSFKTEKFYFLKNSNNIAVSKILVAAVDYNDQYTWQFIPSENLFIEKDSDGNNKCGWLSAELFYEDSLISDLTEWIDNLRFTSKNMPPVSCLIQAWAIKNNYQLESLEKYRIKVLNELMEEKSLTLGRT